MRYDEKTTLTEVEEKRLAARESYARLKNDPRPKIEPTDTCNARARGGPNSGYCQKPAGYGTDHPGYGRCKFHGGATREGSMRYARMIRNKEIADLIEEQEDDVALDTVPEIKMLRAILADFVNRYQDWLEMMEAWYESFKVEGELATAPKPSKLMTLLDAADVVDRITKAVERVRKAEEGNGIKRTEMLRVMSEMGRAFHLVVAPSNIQLLSNSKLTQTEAQDIYLALSSELREAWLSIKVQG